MELKRQGLAALRKELGYVDMVRFLHQFDTGNGNYTKERHLSQDGVMVADLVKQIKERRNQALDQ